MSDADDIKQRDREIEHLQMIEGNPFDDEDRAMFAEFERRGLTLEEQRAEVIARARAKGARHSPAAE
jgi:hypothetical protein